MSLDPPKMKTFLLYNYHDLEKYLLATKAVTQDDVDEFWHWWCDHGEMGNNKICYIPLGYWGWNDGPPETMKTPAEYHTEKEEGGTVEPREEAAFRVLQALLPFANSSKELQIITRW